MEIFVHHDGHDATYTLTPGETLRLDSRGAIAGSDVTALSFVALSLSRVALVVFQEKRVLAGGRVVSEVTELAHGDHVLHGDLELILSTDARPAPAQAPPGSRCVACLAERPVLLGCPRCAALACEACWRAAPRGLCFSTACGQPAALDRPLWTPSPADFLDGAEETP